jgi:hypothetical protein
MPEMISLRNYRLATTTGHVLNFEANKPRYVPDAAVAAAMAAGCALVNADEQPFYDDTARATIEFAGDLRRSLIYLACKAIAEGNDTKYFDSSGTPKHDVVGDRIGLTLSQKEVRTAYEMYTSCRAEGRDPALHPESQFVLRVAEAEGRPDLLELAKEYDYPEDKVKGLSTKELRKLLLLKVQDKLAAKPVAKSKA